MRFFFGLCSKKSDWPKSNWLKSNWLKSNGPNSNKPAGLSRESSAPQRGSETPGNETARSPVQWAKEVHQPVVNDRAGKRGIRC